MEDHEKIDGKKKKKKSVALIPANYVSILQLQERWLKEKEKKQKEKDFVERGVKQQVDQRQRRREEEENVVKAMETKVKLEEHSLSGGVRMHCSVNRWKRDQVCVKKEEIKVSGIVSNKDEDSVDSREKKKKNPVKENTRRVFKSKGENAAKEVTQCWIKKKVEEERETSEVKGTARLISKQGYYQNKRHDWSSTRVIRATTSTMVWVKKGKKDGAVGENKV
ncbi:unnamed protein product [Arabidopsis thaliana]|uniref:Uncharacterized protein n=2 Tax=Arabidopsis TaxID=3701 RepID=A0A5S9SXL7_ARATH|nr:hypothetical protein ISN44_As06g005650 [Arabidopsis suecica]CAA0171959.1 unnamed protein product [Arabidopsis thaliana]VYS45198.1 unnamed protein product [Arabidopsis thaliana]